VHFIDISNSIILLFSRVHQLSVRPVMNSEERELDTPSSEESNLHSGYESAESNRLVICGTQNVMGCAKSLCTPAFVKMVRRM
jgi:hypothetical protein